MACRRALLAGARFWVSDEEQPASQLAAIYEVREAHTRRIGIPTVGFAAGV
ncbi:hypothetical protein ACFQ1L_23295 [Phytohabitans flavus]|uniref:hypothetical protein n=1 Tax=Phytohabitans flavus TaxID=1076124 RepID=UPI0015638206|nr:hypothetical protein [Phytohabitans flavus]